MKKKQKKNQYINTKIKKKKANLRLMNKKIIIKQKENIQALLLQNQNLDQEVDQNPILELRKKNIFINLILILKND